MPTIHNVTFDCAEPSALAEFWASVLGREVAPGANEFVAVVPGAPGVDANFLFLKVPEPKTAKNRMHLDLDVADLAAERARLEALGATFVHEKDEWGLRWMTFTDPEGNEFCAATH